MNEIGAASQNNRGVRPHIGNENGHSGAATRHLFPASVATLMKGHSETVATKNEAVNQLRGHASFSTSRSTFPALKCGLYLPGTDTFSPIFGFRPTRGGRQFSENEPKPPNLDAMALRQHLLDRSKRCGLRPCQHRPLPT